MNSGQVNKEMLKLKTWQMGAVDEPARFFAFFIRDACEHVPHLLCVSDELTHGTSKTR